MSDEESNEDEQNEAIKARLDDQRLVTEDTDQARNLHHQSGYGTINDDDRVQLSLLEGLYLMKRGKVQPHDGRGKDIDEETYIHKAKKAEPNFWVRFKVFKDIRQRGYIIKTALKFGADFRVYDRGIKPGEDHARWVVYPVHEGETLTWYEFAAKNRVAHSTKKRLLIGVVDDEGDVSYWEVRWMRP
jgi:tRNA-intron endonuclease